MDNKDLKVLLKQQTGSKVIVPRYNYTMFAIRTTEPKKILEILKKAKTEIENSYKSTRALDADIASWNFLDFVGLILPKSVLLSVPFSTNLNVLSGIVNKCLQSAEAEAQVPQWS